MPLNPAIAALDVDSGMASPAFGPRGTTQSLPPGFYGQADGFGIGLADGALFQGSPACRSDVKSAVPLCR
jgi:hypothetical protein